jgi:hypothetical protein
MIILQDAREGFYCDPENDCYDGCSLAAERAIEECESRLKELVVS